VALAVDLEGRGRRYAIDRRRARSERLLTLLVRRQDREAAAAVDAARARMEAPLDPEEEEPSNVMPFPGAAYGAVQVLAGTLSLTVMSPSSSFRSPPLTWVRWGASMTLP
jgi:hypothetical protein